MGHDSPFLRSAALSLALVLAAACGSSSDDAEASSSSGSTVNVVDEPPGLNCPAGGKRLVVQNGTAAPTTSYVCNGVPGGAGGGASVTVIPELPGANCPVGGQKLVSVNPQTAQPQVSYVCNGMPAMPQVHAPWDVLSASSVAAPNQGYFTVGSSKVTVTLPVSPYLLPGDAVDVQAAGAGGFALVPGASQQILFSEDVVPMPGNTWTPRGASRPGWSHVVSSMSGAILAATADNGPIDVSTDSGATWTATGPAGVSSPWSALAASADGTRLFAATPTASGRIYVSVDAGQHWGTCTNVSGNWSGLAVSADGNQLVATMNGGNVWVITNIGATGANPFCNTPVAQDWPRAWTSVASSADGSVLQASVRGGQLYMSTDFGDNWTARAAAAYWDVVVSSANGARVVAAMNTAPGQGQLFVSDDLGFSWTPLVAAGPSWPALAMSADGRRLTGVACTAASSCQVMVSADGGAHWTSRDGVVGAWTGVASSADGLRLLAAKAGDRLQASAAPSGTSALLEGVYGSRVQVRYAGPNTWIVSDALGTILAF